MNCPKCGRLKVPKDKLSLERRCPRCGPIARTRVFPQYGAPR